MNFIQSMGLALIGLAVFVICIISLLSLLDDNNKHKKNRHIYGVFLLFGGYFLVGTIVFKSHPGSQSFSENLARILGL